VVLPSVSKEVIPCALVSATNLIPTASFE